jgi:hypothetical protein
MNRKSTAIVLLGLMFLLSACEKDVLSDGLGNKVIVNFEIDHSDYDANKEVTRSFGAKELKPETVLVPLGNELYLSATLMPDSVEVSASNELRAALAEGQRVCIAAYATGNTTTAVATGNYKVEGGALKPDGAPLGVEPGTYYFVAYSYFNGTAAYPATTNIDPTTSDLIWARTQHTISMAYADRTVILPMAHKFSRVRVQVDASSISGAAITALGNVGIEGGKKADLAVGTGDITATGTAVTATFPATGWTTTPAVRISPYQVFYPSITKITVGSLSIKINDGTAQPFSNLSATFTQALAEATNYKIMVDVRANRWAHSNIYWDETLNSGNGGLTFDKTLTNPSHADYQGVLFKWGSLIGISPVGESANAIVYIPNVGNGTWDGTQTMLNSGFGGSEGILPPLGDFVNLLGSSTDMKENYLYENPNFNDHVGDICSYLTDGDWRLPNMDEFGVKADYDVHATNPFSATDPSGRASMGSNGVTYHSAFGTVFFPRSGMRHPQQNFSMQNVGGIGFYWSGSRSTTAKAIWVMQAYSAYMEMPTALVVHFNFSVRCIKALSTD